MTVFGIFKVDNRVLAVQIISSQIKYLSYSHSGINVTQP